MVKSKKKEEEEDAQSVEKGVTQTETLDRIFLALSEKLPNQDDRELLEKLIDAMKNGGP